MKACKACGADYRKGRVATVLGALGAKPTRGRVCPTCAASGVLIVPTIRLTMAKVVKVRKVPELFACSHPNPIRMGKGPGVDDAVLWCASCGASKLPDSMLWNLPDRGASHGD